MIDIISTFTSGKAIVTALQGEGKQTWLTPANRQTVDPAGSSILVNRSMTSREIMNTISTRANHYASTATLLANEVNKNYNNLIPENQEASRNSEKKISEAVEAVRKILKTTA